MKVGIITPGGDAPGINACIRSVVRMSVSFGFEVLGIYQGYQGLLNSEIFPLTSRSVSGIMYHGGTILKSTRCQEIKTNSGIEKAVTILKKHNVGYLVVIGGDGSMKAAFRIAQKNIPVIGIPATIDNDVYGTEESIGFDTAIDTAIEAIDKIRDTATSFTRIFIVEVMGREHGFLALAVGLASGAEFVFIPEIKYKLKKKVRGEFRSPTEKRPSKTETVVLEEVFEELKKEKEIGKSSGIIVFAEGCGDPYSLAKLIEKNTGLEVRVSSLGYIQRGGNPTARSRILGSQFGAYAVELIKKGIKNQVVVLKNGKITSIPLSVVVSREKEIDFSTFKLIKKLAA